jgi:iron-sulfur cluster repair protein YtfE (RIC family)
MSEILNIKNQVGKIAKEHQLINNYVVTFNKAYQTQDPEFFKGLVKFFKFLEKELLAHFRFEEIVVFPAFIAGEASYDNILMVTGLQKEHGILEERLEYLIQEIRRIATSGKPMTNKLMSRIKKFIDLLSVHAKRELVDLFPVMNENVKSMEMLKVYIKEIDKV